MIQKLLRNIVIGLLVGLSTSYIVVMFTTLSDPEKYMTGKGLLEEVIIAASMGVVIGTAMLIFEASKLSYTAQLSLHFIVVTLTVFGGGFAGSWFDYSDWTSFLRVFLIQLVAYVIIWFMVLIILKKEVSEINAMLKSRKENS